MIGKCEQGFSVRCGQFGELKVKSETVHNGQKHEIDSVEVTEHDVACKLGNSEQKYNAVFDEASGLLKLEQTLSIKEAGKWNVYCDFEIPLKGAQLHIPTVMYRNNDRGQGTFPTGGFECGWYFCEDRMPLPGCAQVYSDNSCMTVFMNPVNKSTELISVRATKEDDKIKISTQFPSNESPISYSGKMFNSRVPHEAGELSIEVSEPTTYTRVFYFMFAANNERMSDHHFALYSYEKAVAYVTNNWNEETINDQFVTWDEYFEQKLTHLKFLTDKCEDGAYVKMGKNNVPQLQPYYEFTGASFLVKSLEAAVIYAKTGDLETAEAIGRYFLQAEQIPGVFRENHNLTTGEWGGYLGVAEDQSLKSMVNARATGEALLHYVILYELLKESGKEVPEFLALSKRVAEFYMKAQLPDGCYGRWFTPEGKSVNSLGTNGAHIIPFFIKLAPHMEDQTAINESINKACEYYRKLIDNADFYGDTLDADAYDKESGVILMRACLDMYDITKDDSWIEYIKKCARFVLTWTWQYNIAFPEMTPLALCKFLTIGMTNVSVAHHHLDFYGMTMGYDFFRLAKITGEKFYEKMGTLLINACRQMVANDKHSYNTPPEMIGWQPEQMDYTDWDYFHVTPGPKGTFNVCIAWLTVLGLSAYLSIKEDFPSLLK